MTKQIVILGGGTGGTLVANRLRRLLPTEDVDIVVVDQNDDHVYQPGLLFVPFGLTHTDEIVRSRHRQLHRNIEFRQTAIEHVDIDGDTVHLADGAELAYDVLVVASGSILVTEETEGLTGPGWMEKVFTFYDVAGAWRCMVHSRDSMEAVWWSTWSTCPSSARSHPLSSAS